MRRIFHLLGWLGCGASALLFAVTVVFWLQSLGSMEYWNVARFDPNFQWSARPRPGWGMVRRQSVWIIRGQLWLESSEFAPATEPEPGRRTEHDRREATGEDAYYSFELLLHPNEWHWPGTIVRGWRFAGVGFRHGRVATPVGRDERWRLAIPLWIPAVIFGLWPGLTLVRRLRMHRRYARGLCPHCGYDLRATPTRCPECGRSVASDKA